MSNNQDQINSKDFLIGSLIGGIVGASIALLWAPKSGRELRTNLNEQALVAKEKGGKLADTAKQKTTSILEKVKCVSGSAEEEHIFPNEILYQETVANEVAVAENKEL